MQMLALFAQVEADVVSISAYLTIVLNTEVRPMIESPEFAEAILSACSTDLSPQNSWRSMLDENRKLTWHSSDGILDRQPAGSVWRRVGDFFMGLLPIDEQM